MLRSKFCYYYVEYFTSQSIGKFLISFFFCIFLNFAFFFNQVKEKPTVEQFISMNRGINNGGDLPRELLEVYIVDVFVIISKYLLITFSPY